MFLTCLSGKLNFLGNSNYKRTGINPAHQIIFFGLVKMTLGLVHANYSLLEWQAVELTFFAPCKIAFITCVNRLISIYSFSYLATRLGGINQRHYKYYPLLRLMRSSFVLCPQA